MLRNKKSLGIIGTLMSVILTIAIFWWFIVSPGKTVYAHFFGSEDAYSKSFGKFVDEIDRMSSDRQQSSIKLDEESAIIGFSKGADSYKCYNCFPGRDETTVSKPQNKECVDNPCICLCNGKFKLEDEGTITHKDVGKCQENYICKTLDYDITAKTTINKRLGDDAYWSNGFLFAKDIKKWANALENTKETINLYVEKECIYGPLQEGKLRCSIGVCNEDMLNFNEEELKLPEGTCINDYWNP